MTERINGYFAKDPMLNGVNHLSGRSKRRLKRMNTVHLEGLCPNCKDEPVRFYKDLVFKGRNPEHNKWYCKKCKKTFRREDLKYVKYIF